MKRLLSYSLLFLLLILLGRPLKGQEVSAYRNKVEGGYNFWLYTPPSYHVDSLKRQTPLVVFLHGKSLCGNNLNSVLRYGSIAAVQLGREIDALILAPQNPGGAWNPDR